jgi:hypothetical protein
VIVQSDLLISNGSSAQLYFPLLLFIQQNPDLINLWGNGFSYTESWFSLMVIQNYIKKLFIL